MSDEWADSDDPRLRALCGYALRDHVRYQDGRDGFAPALVFADADYEVGDGTCGLHSDGKQANEPAIVYVRADALIDATARIEALQADMDAAVLAEREACADVCHEYSKDHGTGAFDRHSAECERRIRARSDREMGQ